MKHIAFNGKKVVRDASIQCHLPESDQSVTDLQHHFETASKNAQYTSPSVQNKLIVCAGKLITDEIAARVNAAKSFAILADETTDSSCKEQLSVCVRYVHYDAYERILLKLFCILTPVGDITVLYQDVPERRSQLVSQYDRFICYNSQ